MIGILSRAVDERREADVERDVVDAGPSPRRRRRADILGDSLEVGEQRRVERLDQAGRLEVGPVGDARMDDVRAVARCDLGERLDVVLEERELERAPRVELAVGVAPATSRRRVVVAGPLEEGDRPVRLARRIEGRAGGGRRLGGLGRRRRLRRLRRRGGLGRLRRGRRRRGVVAPAARREQRAEARRARERDEASSTELAVRHPSRTPFARDGSRSRLNPLFLHCLGGGACGSGLLLPRLLDHEAVLRRPVQDVTRPRPPRAAPDLVVQAVHDELLAGAQLDDVLRHRADVDDVGNGAPRPATRDRRPRRT